MINNLCCPNCQEPYDLSEKTPYTLFCHHHSCKNCIWRQPYNIITCRLCNQSCQLQPWQNEEQLMWVSDVHVELVKLSQTFNEQVQARKRSRPRLVGQLLPAHEKCLTISCNQPCRNDGSNLALFCSLNCEVKWRQQIQETTTTTFNLN